MPADYAVLAPIYAAIGMDAFAESMTPRLIDFAQRHDWLGRRILDAGCGTGASLEWLTRRNYITAGIDQSAEMLAHSRQRLDTAELHHDLRQHDVRNLGNDLGLMDLVLALDVVNELNGLRDLEAMFNSIQGVLNTGKLLIFDMHTIQGLTEQGTKGDHIISNDGSLSVIATDNYDYDRQIHERHFLVFHRQENGWQRSEGVRVLRGYPAQAVAALLQRCGFETLHVVTSNFSDFEPGVSQANRIIFVAQKR